MADWGPTVAEELRRDVRFALGWKVGKKLRPLTDTERDMVADAIVEHIRLCNWEIEQATCCCEMPRAPLRFHRWRTPFLPRSRIPATTERPA